MHSRATPFLELGLRLVGVRPAVLRPLLAAWAAWLFGALGLVAPVDVSAQHFSFRQYTQAEGLTNLATSYLVTARNADMWIGTDSGVFVFDGVSFAALDRRHGLLKEAVRGIAEDPAGRMWVAFDNGLFVGSKEKGYVQVRTADGPVIADAGMPTVFFADDHVLVTVKHKIVELRGRRVDDADPKAPAWTATPLFSAAQIAALPALDDVRSMFNAPDGSLWIGCGRGLCSVAGESIRAWGPREGVPDRDWVVALTDRDGRLWARSVEHLVVREPGAAQFEPRDVPHGDLKAQLTAPLLAFDAQGRVLTRTTNGLARWDGQRWHEFAAENGVPAATITGIATDADGDLWLIGAGQGLWHWRGYGHLESWTRTEGMTGDSVWGILRDPKGRLLFGTDYDCKWLDEAAGHIERCPFDGLPGQRTLSLSLDADGALWFGLDSASVWRVLPGQTKAEHIGTLGEHSAVAQIAFDKQGTGWIGGNANGLHQLDRATGRIQRFSLPGEPSRVWESTLDGRGQRCVATTNGLYRVTGDHAELVSVDLDGAPAGFGSVTSARGSGIWATSVSEGLLHAPFCDGEGARWIEADIVAKAHAYFVELDRRGWVWVGTDQGMAVFDGNAWHRIDAGDGLVWNDTNKNGFFEDADGSVWIGTAAGMTHIIDPEGLIARRRHPLDLRIAAMTLGERPIAAAGVTRLAWESDASFDLRFASHTHGRSANTEFQYRLLGLSPKWLGSRQPEVHLPALEPGAYRLETRMNDPDHSQWSPVVAAEFVVVPPWWRSVYFYIALAVAIAAVVSFAWRNHIRRLQARQIALEAEYKEREALLHRATRDGLTGLWNRSAILEILAREIAQSQRTGLPLTVAILDVDHFKRINDDFGHVTGDEVLRELGGRVSDALRQSDWIGRYGGEELLAVLPGLTLAEAAAPVERLRECVCERAFSTRAHVIAVTLSIGVAGLDSKFERIEDLIASADAALYEAKRTGRNRVVHANGSAPKQTVSEPVES